MAMVTKFIRFDVPLTEEQKAEIRALKDRPIVYDEDCPPMTKEECDRLRYLMKKYNTRIITQEILDMEAKSSATKTA